MYQPWWRLWLWVSIWLQKWSRTRRMCRHQWMQSWKTYLWQRCCMSQFKWFCVCKPGLTGAKCELDHPCQRECKNTHGSCGCSCDPGYIVQNIHECVDLDECLNKMTCGNNSSCVNTAESSRCQCEEGSSLDQKTQKCKPNSPQCQLECKHACGPDGTCNCPQRICIKYWQ